MIHVKVLNELGKLQKGVLTMTVTQTMSLKIPKAISPKYLQTKLIKTDQSESSILVYKIILPNIFNRKNSILAVNSSLDHQRSVNK